MSHTSSSPRLTPARFLAGLCLWTGLLIVGGLATGGPAQDQPPRREEEEETRPPAAQPGERREEEEDPNARPRRVIRVEEPDPTPSRPADEVPLDVDLQKAAKEAKHEGVKQFFSGLAVPHDIVYIKTPATPQHPDETRPERVRPIAQFIGNDPSVLKSSLRVQAIDQQWKDEKQFTYTPTAIVRVKHYEQLAPEQVREFLDIRYEKFSEAHPKYLSVRDQLIVAEQALTAVVRFHDSARERGVRAGAAWDKVRDDLRTALLGVVLKRLQLAINEEDWERALGLARQTAERFPGLNEKQQKQIADKMAKLVDGALNRPGEGKYAEARRRLRDLDALFPASSKATEPIRNTLGEQARKLYEEALSLKRNGKLQEAREKLARAKDIYPLAEVEDLLAEVKGEYPILKVGVRELPVNLSPATAFTDAERQAVELLFEGLVELAPAEGGMRYRPALAAGRPRMAPLGRRFVLPREARWSDRSQITSNDVESTMSKLMDAQWAGRVPAWADLVERPLIYDPFRIRLTLSQGYRDPLSLMDFKVLPANRLQKPDDPDFAKAPIGSGPYRLAEPQTVGGRTAVRFVANPYFRDRPGNFGLPRVREIQFFASSDPARNLANGKIDLLLNVPAGRAEEVKKAPGVRVAKALPTRRVYFLAVNHRRAPLDDAGLRRALALAINREKLLDQFFRPGLGADAHKPLNGPYPVGSWAQDPGTAIKADLYDPARAKVAYPEEKRKDLRLTLKYPSDDPALDGAMKELARQVADTLGIKLRLEAVPPRTLRDEVEGRGGTHDYELAYYFHDYPDPSFWLWPLLDPRSTRQGGPNYLGFDGGANGKLEELFRRAMTHRDFDRVRSITHLIHLQFVREDMPFIPLWQLDRHLAFRADLPLPGADGDTLPIDPLRVFADVEHWTTK